jgi:uncharacterized protein (DUF488 family)
VLYDGKWGILGIMSQEQRHNILTIGHSTYALEHFLALLQNASVTAIADVRTLPFSRHFPHFNHDVLRDKLREYGISYVFLGAGLGGRPKNRKFYTRGVADYEKMAKSGEFQEGLIRVIEGAKHYKIALMCSEHDPLDCHRCLLAGRALSERNLPVGHILTNGDILSHAHIEERLLELSGRNTNDLFASRHERLALAYLERARKVAFAEAQPVDQEFVVAE